MSGEDDYESLPEGTSIGVTLVAGGLAGMFEHCVMYPIDSVKTRQQALVCDKLKSQTLGIWQNLKTMRDEGGWRQVMKGVQVMPMAGPAHAFYFFCYEQVKETVIPFTKDTWYESFAYVPAGMVATVVHDGIMTPVEVVKQRMQMCCSPYKSVTDCARTIYKTEGLTAFYRSYGTNLSMNIPFQVAHFWTYEMMKKQINPNGEYNPTAHALSGAVAGAAAAVATNPLDVCKTLLNTQEPNVLKELNTTKIVGLHAAFKTVWKKAGFRGFYKGVLARILFVAPGTAISWSVYEFFKYYLNNSNQDISPPEDTLASMRDSKSGNAELNTGTLLTKGSGEGDENSGEKDGFWDAITDLPRQVRVKQEVLAESLRDRNSVNSDLVHERTFPNYRTEA